MFKEAVEFFVCRLHDGLVLFQTVAQFRPKPAVNVQLLLSAQPLKQIPPRNDLVQPFPIRLALACVFQFKIFCERNKLLLAIGKISLSGKCSHDRIGAVALLLFVVLKEFADSLPRCFVEFLRVFQIVGLLLVFWFVHFLYRKKIFLRL